MKTISRHYVGGDWIEAEGNAKHLIKAPGSGEPIVTVIVATPDEVDRAVASARAAFNTFSQTSREQRIALLVSILEAYRARIDDIAEAISEEMGCPIALSRTAQALSGLGHVAATIEALREHTGSEIIGTSRVVHEPIGVVALITPWNWPMNQIMAKVAPCIAVGNTMILKPSEQTPTSATILAEILETAGVPSGVFNLVHGDGPGVGQLLARHADVDMVSFTGSTRGGIAVAVAAAQTVKRVHQELGGKSPHIILPDADLAEAVAWGVRGVLSNSGQSCIAPTRMLVPHEQYDEAVEIARGLMASKAVGQPSAEGDHIGPVVNERQFERITGLIAAGVAEGARLVTGGALVDQPGYFVRPTLLADVDNGMSIAREEIFGPVLVMIPYDGVDGAVRIANETLYGLAAYVSGPADQAREVASRLRAGAVFLNGAGFNAAAPFGGYKMSGNGREFGRYGLTEFLETKSILGDPAVA